MAVVKCVCGNDAWSVIRPDAGTWPNALQVLAFAGATLPPVRDDGMPLICCQRCGRFSWADGSLADPEGRLTT